MNASIQRKKDDSDVAIRVNYMVLLHLRVGLNLYVILEWDYKNLRVSDVHCLILKVNTLNGCRQTGRHLVSPPRASPYVLSTWSVKILQFTWKPLL